MSFEHPSRLETLTKDPFEKMTVEQIILSQQERLRKYNNSQRTKNLLSASTNNLNSVSVQKMIDARLKNLEKEVHALSFTPTFNSYEVGGVYYPSKMSNGTYPAVFGEKKKDGSTQQFSQQVKQYIKMDQSKRIKNSQTYSWNQQNSIDDGEVLINKNIFLYFDPIHEMSHQMVNSQEYVSTTDYQYLLLRSKKVLKYISDNKSILSKALPIIKSLDQDQIQYICEPSELYAGLLTMKYVIHTLYHKDVFNLPINNDDISKVSVLMNQPGKLSESAYQAFFALTLFYQIEKIMNGSSNDVLLKDINKIAYHDQKLSTDTSS